MRVYEVITKILERYGVRTAFGYAGGNIAGLYRAVASSDKISFVLSRHEQAAVLEAEGYARASGDVGVAIVSSGPGATNTVTGIADAYLDGVPLVIICGQVDLESLDKSEFQEIDMPSVIKPITKKRYQLWFPEQVEKILRDAFETASSGKPGPVYIDLPFNVSLQSCDFDESKPIPLFGRIKQTEVDGNVIKQAVHLIEKAERPVILAGGGVVSGNATEMLIDFCCRTHISVVSSMMGKGAVPSDFAYFAGQVGTHGDRKANRLMMNCDVLIVAGCRLTGRLTGNMEHFVPNAQIIQIDIDSRELSKNRKADIEVAGDVGVVLEMMSREIHMEKVPEYLPANEDAGVSAAPEESVINEVGGAIFPQRFLRALSDSLDPQNSIVTTDVGQHQIWSVWNIRRSLPRTFLTSGGLGTMGFGFPAAIGAYYACPNKQVVCVSGDGSFQMNLQEMATANQNHIPVKVIVMNNGWLGMVKEADAVRWGYGEFALDLKGSPSYTDAAKAYGWSARQITDSCEIKEALRWLLTESGPSLLEVIYPVDLENCRIGQPYI